ncbi:MAG: EF-P beta-lysylation protein EpmB [Candidatus Azotimanducaceae bacterium]|jgi:EF-P beta-lysylation protein EpmB
MPIIPLSDISVEAATLHSESWRSELSHAFRSVSELGRFLEIDLKAVPTHFPLLVPLAFAARMEKGNPDDPLLRQILPVITENEPSPAGYSIDPLKEVTKTSDLPALPDSNTVGEALPKGLIQKYQGRALVISTGQCAVNCRYCFRRHFPYEDAQPTRREWASLLEHIASNENLSEVILSGGDPLVMSDNYLSEVVVKIAEIPHVEMLRIHTRTPVVIPNRIDEQLLAWVKKIEKPLTFVLHVNHPNEVNAAFSEKMALLKNAGAILLNQSVLLRGVNDSAEVLDKLSRKLFAAGILPYYLHLFDPVIGAHHFDVPEETGHKLINTITNQLPGYLVPKFVQEVPGTLSKQALRPQAKR